MLPETNRFSGSVIVALLLTCLLTFVRASQAAPEDKSLSQQEIIELLQGGVPSSRVSSIIDDRGINFDLTSSYEDRVRNAGGNSDVIDSLRRASERRAETDRPRTGGLIIKTTPGEAQIYLNDEPKGMSSPEGEIRLPDLQPGSYQLRVSSIGYKSYEQSISVSAGQDQTLYVTLVQKATANPRPIPAPDQPIPSYGGLPIPGIRTPAIQFYEGPHVGTPEKSQRVYRTSFARSSTRSIYWELDLNYPAPGSRIDFTIDAVWYRPDGAEMFRHSLNAYAMPTWGSSWHTLNYGWVDAGHWQPGVYRVDILYKGTRLVSGTFEIY